MNDNGIILERLEREQQRREIQALLREVRAMNFRLRRIVRTLQAMLRHGNQAPYCGLAEPADDPDADDGPDELTESEMAQVDNMLRLDQELDDFSKEQDRISREYQKRKDQKND